MCVCVYDGSGVICELIDGFVYVYCVCGREGVVLERVWMWVCIFECEL